MRLLYLCILEAIWLNNKERIAYHLKIWTKRLDGLKVIGVTSIELAEELDLRRNVVSHHLNELVDEGSVLKINTRPVYFLDRECYQTETERYVKANKIFPSVTKVEVEEENTVFEQLIGSSGSLKDIVEQCQSAVQYPPNGLPMLLVGSSGVGKSFLAQLIFDYGHETGVIPSNAPFVLFNCAEYANNCELLSAALFGHCKGAFTGADRDKVGVIEEADGGFLFLDEIHRLSGEGQEKLFLFLDKGVFRRLGESGQWRKANVRLICATTENPELHFLPTFLRRIPLVIRIPAFQERPLKEKLALIQTFYYRESVRLERDLIISSQVVNLLVHSKTSGNIGRLTNAIKLSCANAFKGTARGTLESLKIKIGHLPTDYLDQFEGVLFDVIGFDEIRIHQKHEPKYGIGKDSHDWIIDYTKNIITFGESLLVNDLDLKEFLKKVFVVMNELIDELVFSDYVRQKTHSVVLSSIEKIVNHSIQGAESSYGMKYSGNSIEVISQLIAAFVEVRENSALEVKALLDLLKNKFSKEWKMTSRLIDSVESGLDLSVNELAQLYLLLYIRSLNRDMNDDQIHGVIVAHGHTTASSIASVANRILGQYIFDAFDMPLEITANEIGKKLSAYIETIDTSKGIIILVDMGSLESLYKGIDHAFYGDIALINNVSTQLALDVGEKIINRHSVEEIAKASLQQINLKYHFRPAEKVKPYAILTTCSTGIGTASKIKDLLEKCFSDEEIKVIALDYDKLNRHGKLDPIFKQYDVRMIIGTMNPQIDGVPYVSLENLIMQQSDGTLAQTLVDLVQPETINRFNREILKLFTLENVLNYLSILNPEKIIDQVDRALNQLEKALGIKLQNDHRISLTIHTCCMIERLVIKDPILMSQRFEEFEACNRQFVKTIHNVFASIEAFYKVEIPIAEIGIIHENLKHRVTLIGTDIAI